jgi:hypothetical protein
LNGGAGSYRPSVTVSKACDALAIVKADKTSSILRAADGYGRMDEKPRRKRASLKQRVSLKQ